MTVARWRTWCGVSALASALVPVATAQSPGGAFLWGDGKGRAENDCVIGLVGYSDADLQPIDRTGTRVGVVCTDGDPVCDHDQRRNAVCEFRIGVFLRKSGHASCNPVTTRPRRIRARARTGVVDINLVTKLGLPSEADVDYVSGLTSIPVVLRGRNLRKAGKGGVTLRAKRPRDRDRFRFRCNWAPPPPTTTSTSIVSGCYVDTGLTVIDTCNGLEWEKKATPVGSGVDPANPHDVDNTYDDRHGGDATSATMIAAASHQSRAFGMPILPAERTTAGIARSTLHCRWASTNPTRSRSIRARARRSGSSGGTILWFCSASVGGVKAGRPS